MTENAKFDKFITARGVRCGEDCRHFYFAFLKNILFCEIDVIYYGALAIVNRTINSNDK